MRLRTAIAMALILAAPVAWAGGGTYKNDRWGYSIKVPRNFNEAAMSAAEEWIASKHMGKRALEAKKSQFWIRDNPQIWVIGFPHRRKGDRSARVETDALGNEITEFKNPYKDYKDFVKRESWFVGAGGQAGYYFSKEEEDKEGDVPVIKYEIKVEKNTAAPFRIVAWVYKFPDIDFAVQVKILEDYWEDYESDFKRTLKSFKRIARKRALPGSTTTGRKIVSAADERKMSPSERKKYREDLFEQTLRKETANLPDDWYTMDSKNFVALANADRDFTRDTLNHAEALRKYLDKTFGKIIGQGYVPKMIIRVFKTSAGQMAFHRSSGAAWFEQASQITVNQEYARDRKSWAFESVSGEIATQYLVFRNRLLADNMPNWFAYGLRQHMKFARSKGRRVELEPDEYDREWIKAAIKKNEVVPIKDLFLAGDQQRNSWTQEGSVINYMLEHARGKYRGLVQEYLANLIIAIEEAEAEFDAREKEIMEQAGNAGLETSEETEVETGEGESTLDRLWDERVKAVRAKRQAIREQAFQKTFGELDDRDWERLDKMWRRHAG